MNDVRKEELIRLSMRRDLTPEEERQLENYFAADPQARAWWEEERALSQAVQSLPDVPVSSNFTSRVWEAIELEEKREERRHDARPWFRILLPRLTFAAVAGLAAFFIVHYEHRQAEKERVKAISEVSADLKKLPLPDPASVLRDFQAINRLRRPAPSDDDLLMALQ